MKKAGLGVVFFVAGFSLAGFAGCGGTADELDIGGSDIVDVAVNDVISQLDTTTDESGRDTSAPDAAVDQGGGEDTAQVDISSPVCPEGSVCDDGDPCTVDDRCQADGISCSGTLVESCDDSIECTVDQCLSADDCTNTLKPGWCLVEGECVKDGDFSAENPCMACITALGVGTLFPDDNGTCDDNDPCTVDDACHAGVCVGAPMDCDDNNQCTADICDGGSCVNTATDGEVCDDGSRCTENDICVQDSCQGESIDCDDDNICTDDSCDPLYGCMHVPNNAACDDGNACTTGDVCSAGACQSGTIPLECDDDNICTDDGCVPSKGCVAIPNTDPCDDEDPCTLNDTCRAGQCLAGDLPLECDDDNICTDEVCTPGVGCEYTNNTNPCDDNNECTLDDICGGGQCQPGPGELDCDDENVCTDDACVQGEGCVYLPNNDECEDNDVCTGPGICVDGTCTRGEVIADCDDGLQCTADSCHPVDGCQHSVINSLECRPQVYVDFPERAATLDGAREITILGHVELGIDEAPVPFVLLNGTTVPVQLDGSFQMPVSSDHGFNGIIAEVEDTNSLKDRVVQSYYYSTEWFPFSETDPSVSNVDDGLMLFLGPEVWDDNDLSTYDDIATILTMFVSDMDLMSMISNPVEQGDDGFLCGEHKINITSISYDQIQVDLTPVNGGLYMKVTIPNIRIGISGKYCHVSFSGTATASSIVVTSTLLISIDSGTGQPVISMSGTSSKVNGLSININNFPGFLEDILMFFLEDTLTGMIEDTIEDQIASLIPDLQDMLAGLALDQTFDIPALFDGGSPMTVAMQSSLSSVLFNPNGGTLGMRASFSAPKGTTHEKLGSIGRANCLLGGVEANPAFPVGTTSPQLELALKDDLINELVYALYWGGALAFPIPPEMLGDSLGDYGITDMVANIDFLLPPILSACNQAQELKVAVGDIMLDATLKLFGSPMTMKIYVSLKAGATITARPGETGGTMLGVAVNYPDFVDMEVAELVGNLAGAEDTIKGLVMDTLLPSLLGTLDGVTPLVEFEIPSIDMASFIDGVPEGSEMTILVNEVLRAGAFTVASGDIQ